MIISFNISNRSISINFLSEFHCSRTAHSAAEKTQLPKASVDLLLPRSYSVIQRATRCGRGVNFCHSANQRCGVHGGHGGHGFQGIFHTGWWFQILFSFHFIYGMSSFPLTNSMIFQDGEIAPPTSHHFPIFFMLEMDPVDTAIKIPW